MITIYVTKALTKRAPAGKFFKQRVYAWAFSVISGSFFSSFFFHSHFVFTEKDTNNDILWTWSYPAVSEEQRSLFTRKSCLSASGDVFTPFLYSQHNKNWYYILTSTVQEMDNLPKVCIYLRNIPTHTVNNLLQKLNYTRGL